MRWQAALLFATLIRFDWVATRALWVGIERTYKRIVRTLLAQAARQVHTTPSTIA